MTHHYEEYRKLEKVCKEISFQFAESETDRNLNLFARKDVKKETFDKVVHAFNAFYQRQNLKIQEEIIPVSAKNVKDVIAKTQAKFSVVIDFSEDPEEWSHVLPNKMIVYGERKNVGEAVKFFKLEVKGRKPLHRELFARIAK